MQIRILFRQIFTSLVLIIFSIGIIHPQQISTLKPKMRLSLPKNKLSFIAFSPDGKLIATVEDGSSDVWVWEIATGQRKLILNADKMIFRIEFSPDGQMLIAATVSWAFKCWDVNSGELKATILESNILPKASVRIDGKTMATASAAGNSEIKLWYLKTGQSQKTISHAGNVVNLTFDPTGKILASSNFEKIYFWDANAYQLKTTLIDENLTVQQTAWTNYKDFSHKDTIYEMKFSPDGRVLGSVSRDETAKLWDVQTGKLLSTLTGFKDSVDRLAFSPNGKIVAIVTTQGVVRLWEVETGKLLSTLSGNQNFIWSNPFSFDGKLFATGNSKTVKLWNVETGNLKETLENARQPLAFSPTERILVTAGQKNTILVWDIN